MQGKTSSLRQADGCAFLGPNASKPASVWTRWRDDLRAVRNHAAASIASRISRASSRSWGWFAAEVVGQVSLPAVRGRTDSTRIEQRAEEPARPPGISNASSLLWLWRGVAAVCGVSARGLLTACLPGVFALAAAGLEAGQLTLHWDDNSDNETGFKLERSINGSGFVQIATLAANVTSYTDVGLAGGASYSYRVRAYNDAGDSDHSNIATGEVASANTPPSIGGIGNQTIGEEVSTGPLTFTVSDAETAAGSLVVTASSSNTILAPESGIVLGGSGSMRTVTITPAPDRSGSATITVTVSDGSLSASEVFLLTVNRSVAGSPVAPVIASHPASLSVQAGESATFVVNATGHPAPAYQWRFNGTDIAGATAAVYAIDSAQAGHAGSYSVVAVNSAGSATSHEATLSINTSLTITTQPRDQAILRWFTAALSVEAAGGGALHYQWHKGASGDIREPISGATSATYITPALSESGVYWARVTAGGGAVVDSDAATITVNRRAQFYSTGAGAAAFALLVESDDTARMLGALPDGRPVHAAGFGIAADGSFRFDAGDAGPVSGLIRDGVASGEFDALGLSFAGFEEGGVGATSQLAGFYRGVVLNSSDGEILVLAGRNGNALALVQRGGAAEAAMIEYGPDGALALNSSEGWALHLEIEASRKLLTGTFSMSGQSMTVSAIPATASPNRKLSNTSIRAHAGQGSELMVAGFVIAGEGAKSVLVRAVGPTLTEFGVSGVLTDPVISVFRSNDPVGTPPIASNNDWETSLDAAAIADVGARLGAFALPRGSRDAAVLLALPSGAYTAHVAGVDGGMGAAIVEVYDADDPKEPPTNTRLANISMRGVAGEGDAAVVAGFVVSGAVPKQVLIRAVGPELAAFDVANVLADPVLTVFQRDNERETVIASNDDWGSDAAATSAAAKTTGAFALAPGSKSAALVLWLAPGVYTAQATGGENSPGIALVEVYELQ